MREYVIKNKKTVAIVSMVLLIGVAIFVVFSSGGQEGPLDENINGGKEGGSAQTILKSDVNAPFTIFYLGVNDDGKDIVSINDSSPKGRAKAVEWLKNEKFDMLNIEIRFEDFKNPLVEQDSQSG